MSASHWKVSQACRPIHAPIDIGAADPARQGQQVDQQSHDIDGQLTERVMAWGVKSIAGEKDGKDADVCRGRENFLAKCARPSGVRIDLNNLEISDQRQARGCR